VLRAPPGIAPPHEASRYILTRVLRRLLFVGFMAQLTNQGTLGFEVQIKKPSRWFWWLNHQTVTVGFEAQTEKPYTTDFEAKLGETIATGFEARPGETVTTGFEAKPEKIVTTGFKIKPNKTIPVVLRPNHW
jgi:hypothetical protein